MKRLALAVVMLVALASTAGAADKYVTVAGGGTRDGSDTTNAYSLSDANAAAAAGLRFVMKAGTYPVAINPATGSLSSSRISYVPLATGAVDTTVSVLAITINVPGVTVRGIKSRGTCTLDGTGRLRANYASGDSIVSCVVGDGFAINGAKSSVIYGNTVRGQVFFQRHAANRACSAGVCDTLTWPATDSVTFRRNRVDVGTVTVADDASGDYRSFSFWGFTRHCTVDSNTVTWQTDPPGGGGTAHSPVLYWLANSSNIAFKDNHTIIRSTFDATTVSRGATTYAYYLRDSTSDCTWTRDTMEAVVGTTSGPVTAEWGGQGSFSSVQMRRNWFNSCVLKINGNYVFNDTPTAFKMTNCLVASHDGQLIYTQNTALDSLWLVNNTFYGSSTQRVIGEEKKVPPFANSHWRNNLFLSRGNSTACATNGSMSCIHGDPSYVFSDSNAYYSYAGSEGFSMLQESAGCSNLANWYTANGNEHHSQWINPAVHDTAWATLNLRPLTPASPLLSTFSGRYIGAFADTGGVVVENPVYFNIYSIVNTGLGTISPVQDSWVVAGASQGYTITPEFGSHVVSVLVDGASVGAVSTYTFTSVASNHTIVANFATDAAPPAVGVIGSPSTRCPCTEYRK